MMFETDAFRSAAMTDPKPSVEEQIITLIDQLNAYIEQYHGGSVELDRIDGNQVYVRLGGACEDCPLPGCGSYPGGLGNKNRRSHAAQRM
jgi:Fe-S cluster biogenesis protein NfuA